jgi:hypothetical protein
MEVRSPSQPSAQQDDLERRSRLVSLVYDVLRDMKTTGEATSVAMCSQLSWAFLDRATALANIEAAKPEVRGPKVPVSMYSTAN